MIQGKPDLSKKPKVWVFLDNGHPLLVVKDYNVGLHLLREKGLDMSPTLEAYFCEYVTISLSEYLVNKYEKGRIL